MRFGTGQMAKYLCREALHVKGGNRCCVAVDSIEREVTLVYSPSGKFIKFPYVEFDNESLTFDAYMAKNLYPYIAPIRELNCPKGSLEKFYGFESAYEFEVDA